MPTEEPVFRHGFGETVSDIFKRTRICEKSQFEILEKFQEKMFKPLINSIIFISHLIQVKRGQENKRELKYPDSTHILLYQKTK